MTETLLIAKRKLDGFIATSYTDNMKNLLISQRFLPLFVTQFLGAFNDNLLKNSLVVLITYKIAMHDGINAQVLVTIAAGLFILPFFLFSALAGQLADKYDRAKLTRIIKIFEVVIMCLATIGLVFYNYLFLIAVLFCSGIHSAFFGPIKYALLPQHLEPNQLLTGNAYIEGGTFLAILLGTICGGLLIMQYSGVYIVSLSLVCVALCGYLASRYIPAAPGPVPNLKMNPNLAQETWRIIGFSRKTRRVFVSILAISWFWFIGATFLAQFPTFVKHNLHAEATIVTVFLTLFSIGIAIGSFLCTKLLNGAVNTKYVPVAGLGISLFIVDLYFASGAQIYFNLHGLLSTQRFLNLVESYRIMIDILLIAICAGIYIVPLYAVMQKESAEQYRARIIAANNILNALFMVASAIFTLGMLSLSGSVADVFFIIAWVNLIAVYLIKKLL